MKTSRIILTTLGLLGIFLVAPAAAQVTPTAIWQGFSYHGSDPYYQTDIFGFKAGSTGTLSLSLNNMHNNYINVTGAKLHFDWNQNATASATPSNPIRINQNTVLAVTLSFTVPQTSTASNLTPHRYSWYFNYTGPGGIGTNNFQDGQGLRCCVYVLSSDQADALAAAQQLPAAIPSFVTPYSYCGIFTLGFKTAEAGALCQQSQQQANTALNLYNAGDFADAKTNFQSASTSWNSALAAEKGTGGNLELGQTVQGWGFLLLGIGGLVAGVAGILYAWKRPRELRGMTATAAH